MTLQEAIVARHSVRQYFDKPIEAEKIKQLQDLISECNQEGGLHIQLITNEPNAFAGGLAKYGRYDGNKVEAKTRFTMFNGYTPIDLGIAKCHFEIGAGKECFEWM